MVKGELETPLNSSLCFFIYCHSDNRCSSGPSSEQLGKEILSHEPFLLRESPVGTPLHEVTTFFLIHYWQILTFLLDMESKTPDAESVTVDPGK